MHQGRSLVKSIFYKAKAAFGWCSGIFSNNPLIPKVASVVIASVLFAGAIFLVSFAISSPELPPGNVFSRLDNAAASKSRGNFPGSTIILPSEEDWAAITAFYDEMETGAGSEPQDRTRDIVYTIRPGETLSEIAYSYDISYEFLAWYNNISNANKVRGGMTITIPSLENIRTAEPQFKQQRTRQTQAAAAAKAVRNIQVTHESRNNGSGLTVQFSIVNPPLELRSFDWDLGDGRRSFRENPSYEYSVPKTYVVRLTAQDEAGIIYRSNPLYIDVPHPASSAEYSTTRFVTLSSPDEYFVVNGSITKVSSYADASAAPFDLSESDRFLTKVRFQKSGYYGITVQEESGKEQFYSVFVSPIPTIHADFTTTNFNWYRTQFNTGTASNCGPASTSMAIGWGTGRYFPVSSVREAIGWHGNGSTSFEELLTVIKNQGVPAYIQPFTSVQAIRDVIDSGSIAIILYTIEGVKASRGDARTDLFGSYYTDHGGHYVVIKGYSLNGEYFVIHDPIPSDWGSNSLRYADEISMLGRNRYYRSDEMLRALRRSDMIVVPGHK